MRSPTTTTLPEKFLTFRLNEEEYAIDALKVEGILSLQPVTAIPQAPYYFKGVTTIRGKVSPIISARSKLGMPEVENTSETCIVLVTLPGNVSAGMIVDAVCDVVDISERDVEPPPMTANMTAQEIIGLAKSKEKVRIILDIETFLSEVAAYARVKE